MAAENDILRQTKEVVSTNNSIMMPIVNYEVFIQRRKRQKQSGTTLNVEGSDEKPPNNVENVENTATAPTTTNENQPESKKEVVATDN